MKIFKKGFNYSQDGSGNRLVYHLQGCNFRCKWCSNPEGLTTNCDTSINYTIDEIVSEVLNCRPMFFDGGGITLTGGEATLQFDELFTLFTLLKKLNINTAIESNGSHPKFSEIFHITDHLIMDIKHYDSAKHKYWTGDDGTNTYKNLEKLCSQKKSALIRIPVINHINNEPEAFVNFFNNFNCSRLSFEFLAYHEFGKDKWKTAYEIKDGFVSKNDIEKFYYIFKHNGYKVITT